MSEFPEFPEFDNQSVGRHPRQRQTPTNSGIADIIRALADAGIEFDVVIIDNSHLAEIRDNDSWLRSQDPSPSGLADAMRIAQDDQPVGLTIEELEELAARMSGRPSATDALGLSLLLDLVNTLAMGIPPLVTDRSRGMFDRMKTHRAAQNRRHFDAMRQDNPYRAYRGGISFHPQSYRNALSPADRVRLIALCGELIASRTALTGVTLDKQSDAPATEPTDTEE